MVTLPEEKAKEKVYILILSLEYLGVLRDHANKIVSSAGRAEWR